MSSNNQANPQAAIPVYMGGALPANFAANTAGVQQKLGVGVFYGVNVNTAGVGSTVSAYDGTSTAGIPLGTFSTTAVGFSGSLMGLDYMTGLFLVVTGGTPANVTVSYI